MTDLLERLEARATVPTAPNTNHGLNYNFPLAWYRRPDGDIVQLQSDPNNRAMYEDLGFVLLRPQEAREWETAVRPEVVLEQKHRARLITTIRKMKQANPHIFIEEDELGAEVTWSDMTTAEVQERFDEIVEQYALKKPKLPAIKPDKSVPSQDGGDGATMTPEALKDKLTRGQGYDPITEARRPRP